MRKFKLFITLTLALFYCSAANAQRFELLEPTLAVMQNGPPSDPFVRSLSSVIVVDNQSATKRFWECISVRDQRASKPDVYNATCQARGIPPQLTPSTSIKTAWKRKDDSKAGLESHIWQLNVATGQGQVCYFPFRCTAFKVGE